MRQYVFMLLFADGPDDALLQRNLGVNNSWPSACKL